MTPHLVKWHEKYSPQGLTIVEVDNGIMDVFDDLQQHLVEEGITFPVLHDEGGMVCDRFGVAAYPTAYLVGRDGRILWEGHPGDVGSHEELIERALAN